VGATRVRIPFQQMSKERGRFGARELEGCLQSRARISRTKLPMSLDPWRKPVLLQLCRR